MNTDTEMEEKEILIWCQVLASFCVSNIKYLSQSSVEKKEANTEFIHYNKITFKQLCKMYDDDVYLFLSLIAYTVVVTTKSCKYNPQILLFA